MRAILDGKDDRYPCLDAYTVDRKRRRRPVTVTHADTGLVIYDLVE